MAFELSATASNLLKQTGVLPQLILEIDSFDTIYGAVDVNKIVTIGDELIIGEFIIGGTIPDSRGRAYIQTKGSTTKIKQALNQDRTGASSIQRINIKMADINGELTRSFTPGVVVDDILGRSAVFYLGFKEGAHPQDSIKILNGIIGKAKSGAGFWDLTISHADALKEQELFVQYTSELSTAIVSSDTVVPVLTTDNFLFDTLTGYVESYVRIEDEIIKVGGVTTGEPGEFTACTRAQFGTIAQDYDAGTEVSSIYRLQGNCITLALQILLSGGDLSKEFIPINKIGVTSNGAVNINVISFSGVNVATRYGLTAGDRMAITGSSEALNNRLEDVVEVVESGVNTDVFFANPFILDETLGMQASPISKYYVSEFGCALKTSQVDVERFKQIAQTFSGTFFDYDFLLTEGINARDFIDKEILFPSRLFSIPRKGAVSVGIVDLALATSATPTIGFDQIVSPDKITIERSTTENFYNSVIYKFNYDVIEEKFLSVVITTNEDSQNRIKVGNRPLIIESKGMIDNPETRTLIETNTRRILDRFKFAAESLTNVEIDYKTGFALEVGDVVIFGDEKLQVSDLTQGSRTFVPRLLEVTNKDFDLIQSKVRVDLTDTKFGLDGRFGVISPASLIDTGSTTTSFKIKSLASQPVGIPERDKWEDYFGLPLLLRSPDFSSQEIGTLVSYDDTDTSRLVVSGFTLTPQPDWVIESAQYDDAKVFDRVTLWHNLHTFLQPRLEIDTVTDALTFDVIIGDEDKIFTGSIVKIHNDDFSVSGESVVDSVIGQTVTLTKTPGFTAVSGYKIDLIGFSDALAPYRFF